MTMSRAGHSLTVCAAGLLTISALPCNADFKTNPPVATGSVLQTPGSNSFAAGPALTDLSRTEDFTIEGWVFIPKRTAFTSFPGFLFFQEGLAMVQTSESILGGQIQIFFGVATGNTGANTDEA